MQPGLLVTCLVQQLDDKLGVHVHTVTVAVAGDTAVDARVVQLAEQQPLCLCYSAHRHLHTCTDRCLQLVEQSLRLCHGAHSHLHTHTDRCLQLVEQLDPDSLVKSSNANADVSAPCCSLC